jgi:hypothetical protein
MMKALNQIHKCEICGNVNLKEVVNLGHHPMCDDLVQVEEVRLCEEYPIEILFCETCRTCHQKFQVPKEVLFPKSYHYRSRFTADVLCGLSGLVRACEEKFGELDNKLVLDIGCNDGSLLNFFKEKGSQTIGIEPTDAYKDAQSKGHQVYSDYLSPELALEILELHGHPKIITFTNVFAHIENLSAVLESLRILKNEHTKIVIENHYLGSVIDGNQFDTFYHEHPRTYSYASFKFMAEILKINIEAVEFPLRYGGNIRVFMGMGCPSNKEEFAKLEEREALFSKELDMLSGHIKQWIFVKRALIELLVKRHGKIRAKAFPGRAAILIKMLGINEDMILSVHEKPGSLKINHYVPGTRIPICSDDDLWLSDDMEKPIVNLAWHISEEIQSYLRKYGFKGSIIDILQQSDFKR